jgi:hypothetical protein
MAVLLSVFALSLMFGSRNVTAEWHDCSNTNCGFECHVFGPIAGYCNPPAPSAMGCIQLYGPDCASMDGAYCCQGSPGPGAF